jgi:hypothetical protein
MQFALLQKAIIAKRNPDQSEKLSKLMILNNFIALIYWHAECTI